MLDPMVGILKSHISPPTAKPVTTTLPGLSPGAIAGIAVGTIIGLVLIVGFLLLIFLLVTGT